MILFFWLLVVWEVIIWNVHQVVVLLEWIVKFELF